NVFGNGFLSNIYQPSVLYPERSEPLQDVTPKEKDNIQRSRLRFIESVDRGFLGATGGDPQVEAAIENYEVAYRMQTSVPERVARGGESEATKKLSGLDSDTAGKRAYPRQCLLARRLVERGVRFIELSMVAPKGGGAGNTWDQHDKLKEGHEANAFTVDQ